MRKLMFVLSFSALALAGCSKDNGAGLCRPNTLRLNFSCGEDLAEVNGLAISVKRADGITADFATSLKCPDDSHRYDVQMPTYTPGESFAVTGTPTKDGSPVAPAKVIDPIVLQTGCTSSDFRLGREGQSTPTDAMPGAPRVCSSGDLGCACKEGDTCSGALKCREGLCISETCGDGVQDPGEECDDGNTLDADLCSSNCKACETRPGFLKCGNVCIAGAECCPNTPCGANASCSGDMLTPRSTCGANGKCPASAAVACDSFFTCADATSCRTTCSSNTECTTGRQCINGACITATCGNGMLEGEECDDGNKNDTDLCSNACVPCAKRPNWKVCQNTCIPAAQCCGGCPQGPANTVPTCQNGACVNSCPNLKCADGTCLPAGQECCADADCAKPATAGKCDSNTKTCWKLGSKKLTPVQVIGMTAYDAQCSANVDYDDLSIWRHHQPVTAIAFRKDLPAGTILESATLSVYQHWVSDSTAYTNQGGANLRVENCSHAGDCTECPLKASSPVLCSTVALGTCRAEVTSFLQSTGAGRVLKLGVSFYPDRISSSGVTLYGRGPNGPALDVTYLTH